VLGPLYGAVILAVSTWQTIFWVNLVVGLGLATTLLVVGQGLPDTHHQAVLPGPPADGPRANPGHRDFAGALLGMAATTGLALVLTAPHALTSGLTTGLAYISYLGDSRWSTPLAFATIALAALFFLRELAARRPLLDLRAAARLRTAADLLGAALLGTALAGVVLAFATADPAIEVLSPLGSWFLVAAAAAGTLFWWRQRTATAPLVPRRALTARAAWGSLLVSFFIGSSLIAALVDVPVFARVTVYQHSQVGAALVLVRLLAALPLGALAGGFLLRRVPAAVLVSTGMALAVVGFVWMTGWDTHSLGSALATVPLVLAGLGFGLAIAPVNASLLAATRTDVHGVASAFLVVARMVGMLVGISALTTLGLRRFYAVVDGLPSVQQVCHSPTVCNAYVAQLKLAGIAQLHAIFGGAAACAAVAAVLAVVVLRPTPSVDTRVSGARA
jgi:FtsH-binding integral membrane protein